MTQGLIKKKTKKSSLTVDYYFRGKENKRSPPLQRDVSPFFEQGAKKKKSCSAETNG